MSLFLIKRFLLPFLICSVALSCRRYHEPIEIAKAEANIHTNPQLSRNLLDNVEKYMQDNAPQLERTHYELLSIQANDKLRVPQPNDSAISRIVNFFEQSKQNRYVNDLMLAYYYKGSFFRDRHDVPRAVKFYLKAINSADTAAVDFDYDAYCAILTQLGYLYSDECMKEEHLAMARRSFSSCPRRFACFHMPLYIFSKTRGTPSMTSAFVSTMFLVSPRKEANAVIKSVKCAWRRLTATRSR